MQMRDRFALASVKFTSERRLIPSVKCTTVLSISLIPVKEPEAICPVIPTISNQVTHMEDTSATA